MNVGLCGPKSSPGGRKEGRANTQGKGEKPKKSIPFWVGANCRGKFQVPKHILLGFQVSKLLRELSRASHLTAGS